MIKWSRARIFELRPYRIGASRKGKDVETGESVVNVSRLIDEMPLTRLQIAVVALCALVNLLDGADTQSIGVAAPFIANALAFKMGSFGAVFAASQLGAALGALAFGPLADRFGRKTMLVVAVFTFAVFTLATLAAPTLVALIAIRFFAGVGLGGATPCFLTMTSDYSPRKQRGTIATIIWSAYPLGAAFGSFSNAYVLTHLGWQAIFIIGGILPLAITVLLILLLPESVQYLAARSGDRVRIASILARMGQHVDEKARFIVEGNKSNGVPLRSLLEGKLRTATMLLWVMFFFAFATTNVMVMWTPTLLHKNGISHPNTAIVLAFFNIGAFIGMAAAGRLIDRFGATRVLLPAFVAAAASIAALGSAHAVSIGSVFGACLGLSIGLGGAGAIAIASLLYAPAIRSTGIGWGMGSARLGQFVSPLVIGSLLTAGLVTDRILIVAAMSPIIAALTVIFLWLDSKRHSCGGETSPDRPLLTELGKR
ncbi:MFS transporter [Burkholderia cenocepacia]|uniref:MFS transporter n=1 Tax=Burkholderia cenocepacia TaxID=95486 RepID=UPI000F57F84F|nr:MFS transporter [Burkholderia cenocepacia]